MLKRIEELIGSDCPDLPALLDGLPMGVVLLDDTGRVLMLNKALEALTGYSREEVRGLPCRHVLRSRACVQGCPHGREEGPGIGIETDCINRHRRKIPVRITPVRVNDGNNRPVCVLDVVEDLTSLREIEARLSQATGQGQIVGRSPAMEKLLRLVPVIAQHDSPVLITGETGTGKDLMARAIHALSGRKGEFVALNVAGLEEQLFNDVLFGHAKGAFTSAVLAREGLLRTQLRAMARASGYGPLRALVPMVSGYEEMRTVRSALDAVLFELRSEGFEVAEHVPLGAMIEVPSAAISLPDFIGLCDFLSIGTNDLVQYLLAADRTNEALGELYSPLHPAVLRVLRDVVRIASRRGKPVAVCGEIAGDPMFTPLLLALGIGELSLHPATMLEVRRAVRACDLSALRAATPALFRARDRAGIEAWLKAHGAH